MSQVKSHCRRIESWSLRKNYQGKEILPIPKTKEEILVHICDYLASRKCISFEFDEQNNIKN